MTDQMSHKERKPKTERQQANKNAVLTLWNIYIIIYARKTGKCSVLL